MKATLTPLTLAALVGYGLCYDRVLMLESFIGVGIAYLVVLWVLNFKRG